VPALGSGARTTTSVELVAGVDAGQHYGTGGYTGPGTYFIRARHSGKVLDVNIDWFRGQDNGQPIYQHDLNNGDNQKFIVEPLPDGYVHLPEAQQSQQQVYGGYGLRHTEQFRHSAMGMEWGPEPAVRH
jgi:hypothetical protein